MKKTIRFFILIALAALLLAGCNGNNNSTNTEREEEKGERIKVELKEEKLEEKDHEKITKMSEEELLENEAKYSVELYDLCENLTGFYTNDVKESEFYKNNDEFRAYVDKVLAMGYGITQAEGMYYLYVGEEPEFNDGEMDTGENNMESQDSGSDEIAVIKQITLS